MSLVLGLTSPTLWLCAFMHYCMCCKFTACAKSMCGWCFNINVTATTTASCHAWYCTSKHFCRLAATTYSTISFSTYVAKICSSFLPVGTDMNVFAHSSVCVHTVQRTTFLSLMQHTPLHITHQCHFNPARGLFCPHLDACSHMLHWGS